MADFWGGWIGRARADVSVVRPAIAPLYAPSGLGHHASLNHSVGDSGSIASTLEPELAAPISRLVEPLSSGHPLADLTRPLFRSSQRVQLVQSNALVESSFEFSEALLGQPEEIQPNLSPNFSLPALNSAVAESAIENLRPEPARKHSPVVASERQEANRPLHAVPPRLPFVSSTSVSSASVSSASVSSASALPASLAPALSPSEPGPATPINRHLDAQLPFSEAVLEKVSESGLKSGLANPPRSLTDPQVSSDFSVSSSISPSISSPVSPTISRLVQSQTPTPAPPTRSKRPSLSPSSQSAAASPDSNQHSPQTDWPAPTPNPTPPLRTDPPTAQPAISPLPPHLPTSPPPPPIPTLHLTIGRIEVRRPSPPHPPIPPPRPAPKLSLQDYLKHRGEAQ